VSDERYLLDTSALLTLIENEEGAERVEYVLRHCEVLLPWLGLLEVYYITQQEQVQAEADRRYALIQRLSVTILGNVEYGRTDAAHSSPPQGCSPHFAG
jgi:predicted nucleic acid-binding protein